MIWILCVWYLSERIGIIAVLINVIWIRSWVDIVFMIVLMNIIDMIEVDIIWCCFHEYLVPSLKDLMSWYDKLELIRGWLIINWSIMERSVCEFIYYSIFIIFIYEVCFVLSSLTFHLWVLDLIRDWYSCEG